MRKPLLPIITGLLLLAATSASAHGHGYAAPGVVIRTPGFGLSWNAPLLRPYGFHYAPRFGYAPPRGHWYGPSPYQHHRRPHRDHERWRHHFDRFDHDRGHHRR